MSIDDAVPMPQAELAHCKTLFGPPPVLSTEDRQNFEEILDRVIKCLRVQNIVEMRHIWNFVCASWLIDRYTRHGTIAIDRHFQLYRACQAQRAKLRLARKEKQVTHAADETISRPADVARLVSLEASVSETVSDVDEILQNAATELDHNRALQQSMIFQEQLDRLIISQTAIRNSSLRELEYFRVGLGRLASEITKAVIDAEYSDVGDQAGAASAH